MDVITSLKHADLEDTAQQALQHAREFALDTVVPASTDRLRDLAERVQLEKYREQVQHLEQDFAKRATKLERKLERKAKRLPVDTPLDRRRRRRTRRRGMGTASAIVLLAAAAAAGYFFWRARRADDASDTAWDPPSSHTRNGDSAEPEPSDPADSPISTS